MKGCKWISESKILGRYFHVDVFKSDAAPGGLVLWLGGSCIDMNEYKRRENTLVPIFEKAWNRLGYDLPIIFVFVTAPYDIKYWNFSDHIADKDQWNQHVEKEILGNWPDLPVYLIGNSGGAALAFNGVHKIYSIAGAGAIGADQIPQDFEIPLKQDGEPEWILNLYYNWNDIVYEKNERIIDNLVRKGFAISNRFNGGHITEDYIENRSFDAMIRSAIKSFSIPSL